MKVTIDGHVIEGTPEEIKEFFEMVGAKFPVDAKPVEETPKPKTEKRKARVGERILITKPFLACGEYKKDDQFTVNISVEEGGGVSGNVKVEGIGVCILDDEYEVIVEEKAESKRKPGEFKKGDIVRVVKESSGHKVGTIGEVYEDYNGNGIGPKVTARIYDGRIVELHSPSAIIVTAEARLDV